MLNVTMVGCGAIGRAVLAELAGDPALRIAGVVARAGEVDALRAGLGGIAVASGLAGLPEPTGYLLECAGHAAVIEHVLPALARGIDCAICSIGALAEPGLPERIEAAAREGGAQATLLSGAIGGIDALAAARIGGLERVIYTGRKPPGGWAGTPAAAELDLAHLAEAVVVFEGSAREAARLYPKNANVAATVSLAGIGLDRTEVRLVADPAVTRNVHRIHAQGAFGELDLTLAAHPLAANPKTSALTVYSAVRALRNRGGAIVI